MKTMAILALTALALPAAAATPAAPSYDTNWYTGGGVIIDWTTATPTVDCDNTRALSFEGSSTWSDPDTGALQYYTNGLAVYDASDALVTNGSGLGGNPTATETSFLAPVPGSNLSRLFLFSNNTNSVFVSILDTGAGEVEAGTKATLVATNTGEAIGGLAHPDPGVEGFWLVLFNATTSSLDAYLVTGDTIPATPTATSALPAGIASNTRGTIVFSPDSSRIAITTETGSPRGTWWASFDPSTATVSSSWENISNAAGYSVAFSPDGTQIYRAQGGTYGWAGSVYQYDTTTSTDTLLGGTSLGGVALAPDGAIYVTGYQKTVLARIDNPDVGGAANFDANYLSLEGCFGQYNLSKQINVDALVEQAGGVCLLGVDKVRLADRASASSIGSYGTTELGSDATSTSIESAGNVWLRNRAFADGDVTSGGSVSLQHGASVSGVIHEVAPSLPAVPTVGGPGAGSGHLNVNSGSTETLTPGTYGNVTVNSNGTLILDGAGEYGFARLTVNSGATVEYEEGTSLFVHHAITWRGTQVGEGPLPVSQTGSGWSHFEGSYDGAIVAPHAHVRLAGNGGPVYTGAEYVAKELLVETDAAVVCE